VDRTNYGPADCSEHGNENPGYTQRYFDQFREY
jgi:hypothetical protein